MFHSFILGYYAPIWHAVQALAAAVVTQVQQVLDANCPCL
jgi:hypothetical protein